MTDKKSVLNSTLSCAKLQQQEYYELLPDYTKYEKCDYKYLKQNIGFALFGPPSDITGEKCITDGKLCETDDVIDHLQYKPLLQTVIDEIYKKVCEFGEGMVEKEYIYFAIIFNITFCTENNSKELQMDLQTTPIFKIKRIIINNDTKTNKNKNKNDAYEEYYIDAWARVYKSWADYKENNVLPACTMVIPKDGFYQPDPGCKMTEEYSTVWLEILKSPKCSMASTFVNAADKTANIAGMASLGLAVAAIFTPAAPVAVGALATGAVSGIWSAGRSVQNLVDRSTHEQSINITDRNALCSWLTIVGGVLSAAATAGNMLFIKAIKNGSNINTFMKFAYNTVVVTNLGVNGCGVAYNAYCLYEKYTNGEEITTYDVISMGAHILFFGNGVMNFQLAGELIESTQGKILDDYTASLRSKRLRKAFNRAKRDAAANNSDTVAQNAEVIRHINKKTELRLQNNLQRNSKNNSQSTTKNKSQSNSENNSQSNLKDNSKNKSQSNSENNSQSNLKDNSKNKSQSNSENNSQSNLKDNSKNKSQSNSENNSQSNLKDNSKNKSQSNSENNSQSNLKDSSKNNSQSTSKSNSENNSQNNLNNNSKNNSQSTPKSNSQSNSNNSPKNNSQSTSKSNSESNSQNNLNNNSENNSQSTPKGNSQSNSNNSSKNNSQSTSKSNSENNSQNNSQNNLNNNSKNNSQSTSKGNSQSNSNNSSKDNSQTTPKSNSESNSNNNSKNNSQSNSNNSSKDNSQGTSKNNSENNSQNSSSNTSENNSYSNSFAPRSVVSFDKGKIIINGILMLDPIKFVTILLTSEERSSKNKVPANPEDKNSEEMLWKLRTLLIRLLTELFSKHDNNIENVPDISKFDVICEDIKHMKDATMILTRVFEIGVTLVQLMGGVEVIHKAVYFVWCYVKESLTRVCYTVSSFITNPKIQGKISSIITALFEHMSQTVKELLPAFKVYIKAIN